MVILTGSTEVFLTPVNNKSSKNRDIAHGPGLAEYGQPLPLIACGVVMKKIIQPLGWFVVLTSVLAVASSLSLGLV